MSSESDDLLLAELIDLPSIEREAYLSRVCGQDAAMRQRLTGKLEQLLAALSSPPSTAQQAPAHSLWADIAQALTAGLDVLEKPGTTIGRYTLLEKIGEGGCGIVYLAEQQEPVRRQVALKLIKLGLDTREFVARFEAERQALALMEHPNIARVFDAGATEVGRPYFVMELVRGVPITRYCDEHRLPPRERLRLFVTVCQAVQHAHQKGVIHRDLKPSNILVAAHDGVPVAKIIDFGIAKAMDVRLTEKTLFTQLHAFVGTPAYTSPEQMDLNGSDVDTRSDIYSLGVLLYELLTGHPPFDADKLVKSGLEAMRRTIREIDPPRPSARLATLEVARASRPWSAEASRAGRPCHSAAELSTIAECRRTTTPQLVALLRGDLDWIAMRCLEKDRARRYDSATALAADVECHLADTPVQARPPSRLYQTRKFIRRHKIGVAAAAAITFFLVAGLIASSVLRHQAEVARADEVKRSARTALDLANRTLAEGRITDGLAYLVYAARKDPLNRTLGPRLASALTSHNFILPRSAPIQVNSPVLAVRFARDGRSFYVGSQDGTFRVIDSETGAVKRQFHLGHDVIPGGWQFARANDTVVGARFPDSTFGVYDIATGSPKIPAIPLQRQIGLPNSSRTVELSPDGRWIYALGRAEFWLWSVETGSLHLHPTFSEIPGGCDFSPAGDILAIPVGNSIERWSLPSGDRMSALVQFRAAVGANVLPFVEVRFSPDGRRLAIFDHQSGQIVDAATGAQLQTLTTLSSAPLPSTMAFPSNERVFFQTETHCGWWNLTDGLFSPAPLPRPNPFAVSFDAAGSRMLASSPDGLFRIWDAGNATLVAEPGWTQSGHYRAAISPDGTQTIVGTSEGQIYRFGIVRGARPLVLTRTLTPFSLAARFLPGSPARLLQLTSDQATVIDAASGQEVAGGFRYPEPIAAPTWQETHPPIRADSKFMVVRTQRGEWQSWELGPDGVQRVVLLHDAPKAEALLSFSPRDDLVVLAVFLRQDTRVWHLRTGAPMGPALPHPPDITPFTPNFSPDARRIAVGSMDGAATVFHVASARPFLTLRTSPLIGNLRTQFSADGTRLVTANMGHEIRLWDAASGESVGAPTVMMGSYGNEGAYGNAHFSDDSRWLAIWNDKSARLLDGRTGVAVGNLIPAGGKLVRFNPDSTRLATAEREGHAQVWDVPSGEAVTEPMRHQPLGANQPEFSPDGRFLKTENKTINLWAVPPPLPEKTTTPEWLLELATLCASKIVNDAGQLVPATELAAHVERLRQQIATLPVDAPLADWGRWILDDRPDRPIGPGFTVMAAEAEALAKADARLLAP